MQLIQVPRVSVSRERTINLGRFGLQYEAEKIFISVQGDLVPGDGVASDKIIKELLETTETLLDDEVNKVVAFYQETEPKEEK